MQMYSRSRVVVCIDLDLGRSTCTGTVKLESNSRDLGAQVLNYIY